MLRRRWSAEYGGRVDDVGFAEWLRTQCAGAGMALAEGVFSYWMDGGRGFVYAMRNCVGEFVLKNTEAAE